MSITARTIFHYIAVHKIFSLRTKDILTAITGEYHIMRIGLPHLSSWPDDLMDQWVSVWAIFASAELAADREGKLKIASDF